MIPRGLPELKYFSESDIPIVEGTPFSAGLDLPYNSPDKCSKVIYPGQKVTLPTGIHVEIPKGCYGKLDPRSSTSGKYLSMLCHTVDNDYRGEIKMVFVNLGSSPVEVKHGEYLAQIIISPYIRTYPQKVKSLSDLSATDRGSNGFGSTTKQREEEK